LERENVIGFFLFVFGLVLTILLVILLPETPLVALSVSIVLLGLVLSTLVFTPVPQRAVVVLMKSLALQIEAMLEEFKPEKTAVYVYRDDDEVVVAAVPIRVTVDLPALIDAILESPFRTVFVSASGSCLELLPPATKIKELLGEVETEDVEPAVVSVLSTMLEIAEDVKVTSEANRIYLAYTPIVDLELPRFNECMGSLPTSVAACIIAYVTKKKVKFVREDNVKSKVYAVFETW